MPGTTYLAEAIYPENRIVVRYAEPALVLLAAYLENGMEMDFAELDHAANRLGWRTATRHHFETLADLVTYTGALPADQEGFVLRFSDGMRLKLKGNEYRRIHALISNCTPLAMWEAMAAGDDMQAIRRDLPEEFWSDFDNIIAALTAGIDGLTARVEAAVASVAHLSDKELGLSLGNLPTEVASFVFPWRKSGGKLDGKLRQLFYRTVRPTSNVLEGYVPSYAIGRLLDESL